MDGCAACALAWAGSWDRSVEGREPDAPPVDAMQGGVGRGTPPPMDQGDGFPARRTSHTGASHPHAMPLPSGRQVGLRTHTPPTLPLGHLADPWPSPLRSSVQASVRRLILLAFGHLVVRWELWAGMGDRALDVRAESLGDDIRVCAREAPLDQRTTSRRPEQSS